MFLNFSSFAYKRVFFVVYPAGEVRQSRAKLCCATPENRSRWSPEKKLSQTVTISPSLWGPGWKIVVEYL